MKPQYELEQEREKWKVGNEYNRGGAQPIASSKDAGAIHLLVDCPTRESGKVHNWNAFNRDS